MGLTPGSLHTPLGLPLGSLHTPLRLTPGSLRTPLGLPPGSLHTPLGLPPGSLHTPLGLTPGSLHTPWGSLQAPFTLYGAPSGLPSYSLGLTPGSLHTLWSSLRAPFTLCGAHSGLPSHSMGLTAGSLHTLWGSLRAPFTLQTRLFKTDWLCSNLALRPRRPGGLSVTGAPSGHLHFPTAPELCLSLLQPLLPRCLASTETLSSDLCRAIYIAHCVDECVSRATSNKAPNRYRPFPGTGHPQLEWPVLEATLWEVFFFFFFF